MRGIYLAVALVHREREEERVLEQRQLRERREGQPVMAGGAVQAEPFVMLVRAYVVITVGVLLISR